MLAEVARLVRRAAVAPWILAGVVAGCGPHGSGDGGEEYERTLDPGLREEYYWAIAGEGHCPGRDGRLLEGVTQPRAESCDEEHLGTAAVCWDGMRFRHPDAPDEARCVLAGAPRSDCREGAGGGRIWECVRTDAE